MVVVETVHTTHQSNKREAAAVRRYTGNKPLFVFTKQHAAAVIHQAKTKFVILCPLSLLEAWRDFIFLGREGGFIWRNVSDMGKRSG